VRALTVTTYHSAFTLLERHGARFTLLICDEVHRLGLTATYPDGQDSRLVRALGPVVYRRSIGEMTDAELARFAIERRYVELSPSERARYDTESARFETYAEQSLWRAQADSPDIAWKPFAASARLSPAARRALRAFRERERVGRCGHPCPVTRCCHLPMPQRPLACPLTHCSACCTTIALARADCVACLMAMAARFWRVTTWSWRVVCCGMPRGSSCTHAAAGAMSVVP